MIHLWLDFQLIFVRICTYDTCKCDSKMIAIIMWFATPRSTHDMGFSNVQPQQPYFTTELSANCLTLGRGSCTKKVTKVLVPIIIIIIIIFNIGGDVIRLARHVTVRVRPEDGRVARKQRCTVPSSFALLTDSSDPRHGFVVKEKARCARRCNACWTRAISNPVAR